MKYMKTKIDLKIVIIILVIVIFILLVWFLFKNHKDIEYRIILNQGDKYIEPGFSAYKNNDLVTNEVVVTNEIKEDTPGLYRIIYELDNYNEYRYVEIKEVIDYKININLEVDNINLTNKDVIVNVSVDGDTFRLLTLPDGTIINTNKTSFIIKENGTYKFEASNTNNEIVTKEITIDNIDKEAPSGSCTATLSNKSTTVDVRPNESNVLYHYYDNNKFVTSNNKNNYAINNKTSEIIKVVL